MTENEAQIRGMNANQDWLKTLDQENVHFVILDPSDDGALVETLRSEQGWIVDFEDTEAVIFTRG